MDNNLYEMIFKRKSFHLFRNIGSQKISEEEIKDIEKKEEEKSELYNIIESKREKINTKKNIIMEISNKLINTKKINIIDDNINDTSDLNILHIINILNSLDKNISNEYFIPNNNNQSDFFYQKEYNIIKNIHNKITEDYNIKLTQNLEPLYQNFVHFSQKQKNNSKNFFDLYIYDTLYNYIILILILNKNDINNKEIKYLSPTDKIFLCENQKEQKLICDILNTYLNISLIKGNKDIPYELKSIYNIILMFNKIDILEKKLETKNNVKENNNNKLTEKDFCNIISKKDFIINQLESKIENMNRNTNTNNTNNENTFRDLEEENETNKKEIEEMKRLYDVEFELMASAVYGLGINLFFNKEQQHNEQIINNSSWLTRQKNYITDLKE
jgi:hypothetical protein